jgi:hypothetical protein
MRERSDIALLSSAMRWLVLARKARSSPPDVYIYVIKEEPT